MSAPSTIKLNGKHYDAVTGVPVGGQETPKAHQHVDGIVSPTVVHHQAKPAAKQHQHQTGVPEQRHRTMQDVRRPASRHRAAAHTPQPARTLMRSAVAKPQPKHRQLKAHGEAGQLTKHVNLEIAPKLSIAAVDDQRLKHAKLIPKNRLISHYNPEADTVVPVAAPVAPAAKTADVFRPQSAPVRPHRPQTTSELLQHAIDQANSHQQSAPRVKRAVHRSRRIASVSTLALFSILLFGFVLHQNMPNLKLDLASSKAGFAASLPANQPPGFSLNGLSASTGQVAMHFRSNSDNSRSYTITEKPSDWDSATLRDSFVASSSGNDYQAVQAAGRTLYLFGHQNITWVNGGVWYLVRSDGVLSNQQLINLATSL